MDTPEYWVQHIRSAVGFADTVSGVDLIVGAPGEGFNDVYAYEIQDPAVGRVVNLCMAALLVAAVAAAFLL